MSTESGAKEPEGAASKDNGTLSRQADDTQPISVATSSGQATLRLGMKRRYTSPLASGGQGID